MKQILFAILFYSMFCSLMAQTPFTTINHVGVTLMYRVTQDALNLECRLSAATTGWVGVGFRPETRMQNANIIIGFVANGTVSLRDDFGTSPTSHASDTSLGGTNNLSAMSGTESNGTTQLNFMIPLNSGDNKDRILVIGNTYPILLARGSNGVDNFTTQHEIMGITNFTVFPPVANQDEIETASALISNLHLEENPVRKNAILSFSVHKRCTAHLTIYNMRGEKIKGFVPAILQTGEHKMTWDGTNASNQPVTNGIYLYQLHTNGILHHGKMLLLR